MSAFIRLFGRLPSLRPGAPSSYLVAAAMVAAAAAARFALQPWLSGVQFLTFFLGVIVVALVAGTRAGLLAVMLSTLASWLAFFPEGPTWANVLTVLLFAAVAGLNVIIIGSLRAAIGRVRELNATLSDSEARFRGLLESAPDAMVIVNGEGRITLVNARTETLFGFRRGELIGQPVEMLMPASYRNRHASHVRGFFAHPETRPMGRRLELRGARRDGSQFPVEISLSPLQTDHGMLASSTIRDISEQKAIEARLIRAQEAAQAANRAKSDFLASMSHELRTPLNAVIGFGQLLDMNLERNLSDKQREYVADIVSAGTHLLHLVNEVLDLAAIEAGKLQLNIEAVAVRGALDYVRAIMSPIADRAGVELAFTQPEDLPDVAADGQRLLQILLNLVSNAVKYNRTGGTVAVSAGLAAHRRIRFTVSDNGIGIQPEQQQRLFQPFQRLGAERLNIEGAGIGLAFSRRMIEAMAGKIDFSSTPGAGSTFWIELPIAGPGPVTVQPTTASA